MPNGVFYTACSLACKIPDGDDPVRPRCELNRGAAFPAVTGSRSSHRDGLQ
jgi:hypothetical protein